ncbi:restriction endonuclease subunit S [Lacticaseibacillus manihotivorans]|uniref:restriction endonuclease subunit S n=1 Tax=Lacticaseibacillus manihotivorans TaxID=88233 RepID=UPI001FB280CE|nr:restriction endonuclease subunit S [Lacticaseibacillus manihotivorans]
MVDMIFILLVLKKYKIDVPAFEGPAITIAGNGATVGYMHLADNQFNAYQRTYVLQNFVVNRGFLFSEIGNKLPQKIHQEARTGNIPYIVMDMLTDLKLAIPKDESEQSKIGSFFKQLDNTIDLHHRKHEALLKLKEAYLQNLFPEKDNKYPVLRFAGFTDDWEQRKLGDIAVITFGQSPDGKNYTDNPNDHILVQGNADIKDGHVVPRVWTKQVTKSALPGDLIFSVRAPVGDVGMTDFPVVLGRGVAGFKANQFVFFLLEKLKLEGYWTRYSSGSTFESVNSKDVKTAPVLSPYTIEQEQIGAFIAVINDTIALHQRKLEKLQELKKGYLQKMFC